jgi:putative transcriptional regulator
VNVSWDDAKSRANRNKHGISFDEARHVFTSGDYLEIFDQEHSETEDRFIAIGLIGRGWSLWSGPSPRRTRSVSSVPDSPRSAKRDFTKLTWAGEMTDIPELTEEQFARAIPARMRRRLVRGEFESGGDIAALRRFVGLTQMRFAQAMGISVHTLRNWEQGRRRPEGPAIALLRIAARHPRIIRENIESAA